MKSNIVTNWLLGIFSGIIIGSMIYAGGKLNSMEMALVEMQTAYNIELPDVQKHVDVNTKNINIHRKVLIRERLLAIKEEEY